MDALLLLRGPFKHDFVALTVPLRVTTSAAVPAHFQLQGIVPPGSQPLLSPRRCAPGRATWLLSPNEYKNRLEKLNSEGDKIKNKLSKIGKITKKKTVKKKL